MEPLQSWEREGRIKWNQRTGMFRDTYKSDDIAGPLYLVTVRVDAVDKRPAYIVREQRALIPSLAVKRVRAYFLHYLPEETFHIVLVRRGKDRWNGWASLDRCRAYPKVRHTSKPTVIDANPQPFIET